MAASYPIPANPQFKNLTGQRFARLLVLSFAGSDIGNSYWNCICDCGNTNCPPGAKLRSGLVKSCGCLGKELIAKFRVKHGHAGIGKRTVEYYTWVRMKERCTDPKHKQWLYYGGRGITVCERWRLSFGNFLADMGRKPRGLSIERRDNNGNYEPSNCYWATPTQQSRNKRNNHLVTHDGQTMCVSAWAERLGISEYTISRRLQRNLPIEKIVAKRDLRRHA